MLLESYGDIAHFVYGGCLQAAEVLHARQDDMDELVEERRSNLSGLRLLYHYFVVIRKDNDINLSLRGGRRPTQQSLYRLVRAAYYTLK